MRKMEFARIHWLLCIRVLVFIFALAQSGYCDYSKEPLEQHLTHITAQAAAAGVDIQRLEKHCLELLKDYNSPADKGAIYSKIALMYAGSGSSSPTDIRIAKTIEYCRMALAEPLDRITTLEMYSHLSDSQIARFRATPEDKFVKARREIIVTSLIGFKMALDMNAPKPITGQAGVGVYGTDNNSVMKKNQQFGIQPEGDNQSKLGMLRQELMGACVELYSRQPYDANELETCAHRILKGHDDAVAELMAAVHEKTQGG
jgi:hypothetical protein